MPKCIYFDNNGTTFPTSRVKKAMIKATDYGNASAAYSNRGKELIKNFKKKVLSRIGNKNAEVIITSGASEGINLFLRSMAEMYPKPHYLVSSIEHATTLDCARRLVELGRIRLTIVQPRADGCIHLEDVRKEMRKNTKVVAVMHINNETGSINDIEGIQKLCRKRKINYLADTVQSFGKYKLPDLDACVVSFHKMYGPVGVGVLVVDKKILNCGFPAQISGTQNGGYRGGTENLPAISGALEAMENTFRNRNRKNLRLRKMKKRILSHLQDEFDQEEYSDYVGKSDHFRGFTRDWNFMQVGGLREDGEEGAPNVLLLSFNKDKGDPHHFCNVKLKKELLEQNIICSIGSACHTSTKNSSHVLRSIKAPFIVRCGVIRVSLGDYNTFAECDRFCRVLIDSIHLQD